MAKSPSGQYTSWIRRQQLVNLLRDKAAEMRALQIQDESAAGVAMETLLEQMEKLRALFASGRASAIRTELRGILDTMKPALDKLRRSTRARLPEARTLAQEIVDLLEELR
jgi:hypothetical protein